MCKNTTRAMRRHHYARLKYNRRQHWGYGHQGWRDGEMMSETTAGMVTRTPTPCSCYMCGNPRRQSWENPLTIQERKAEEAYEYQIEELVFYKYK